MNVKTLKMNIKNLLFWNIDTQIDFVHPDGKLYVPGAELLKPVWKDLTRLAAEKSIRVVNTSDYHKSSSPEINGSPDFVKTFPEHCLAGSRGAEFIKETKPENQIIFDWDREYDINQLLDKSKKYRNIVIRKDVFDVFDGNPYTDDILKFLNPETVIVYGVATNFCVDAQVKSLNKRKLKIYVVEDAIKELPDVPLPFAQWDEMGVHRIKYDQIVNMLG